MCNAFYCRVQKSNFNNTKFAIFEDKYLSQDLIVILRNITPLCQVGQRGVGEGGYPVNTKHLYVFMQCWTNVEDVGPTFYKCYTNVLCLLGSPPATDCWHS